MSRFGNKKEDRLRYKCEKLKKQIVMLLKHIENIEQSNRLYHIITSSMLRKIGGSIDIVDEDEDEPKPFSIGISRNEETKTTTYIYYDMEPTDAFAEIADEQIKKEEI